MTRIRDLEEADHLLARYVPKAKELLGGDITLERMVPLMKALGNPQDKLKIVHIAGTSGKTSTAYYMASLLQASGQKVGLTVSPHLDSVTERVQINLKPLAEAEFCRALGEFLEIIKSQPSQPTYFELLMAFAYWYFAKMGVDYAVIETGLGGLHDASNVANKPDKICVITDIGYDHMHVLGHTLKEIAAQKAGIIQLHNQLFTYKQDGDVLSAFKQRTVEKHAILNVLSESQEREDMMHPPVLEQLPAYQQRNWLLAYKAYEFICHRDNLPAPQWDQLITAMKVQVPGRMDVQKVQGKTLVMDGAHNTQKMQAFVNSFQTLYPHKKAAVLLGMRQGKEYTEVLPLFKPICSRLIVSSFPAQQDLPVEATDPKILVEAAKQAGFKNILVEPNLPKAYQALLDSAEDMLIVTGSFYLLSGVRQAIISIDD